LVGIKRCGKDEFLNGDHLCARCPANSPPSFDKKECIRCPAGTYSNGYSCIPCKGENREWCPEEGMTAPYLKNESCHEPGKLFVRGISNVEDNRCETCDMGCDGNNYVFEVGHNQSNGCSLTESGLRYFACYTSTVSLPPEKFRYAILHVIYYLTS
jgi:hypothetical protein